MNSLKGLSVAVTGMIANESPAPGVAVIRSLRVHPEFKGRVIGLAYDAMEAGNFIRDVVDEAYLIPYPSQGEEDFLQRLLHIKERGGLDVLIPTLDSELPLVIKMSAWLKSKGIATFLPTLEQLKLRAKDQLFSMAKRRGLPVPLSKTVYDLPSVLSLGGEFRFPFLVKGIFYEAYVAHGPEEAAAHFHKIQAKWGLPAIVQEFIAGDEYCVAALGDGKGGALGAVPMRKLQLSDKGKAWAGVTVDDARLMDLALRTVRALEWQGPLELEIMKAQGKYYILEINPRFPAWIYLAQGAGQNLPYACLEMALGKRPRPLPPYKPGVMFIRAAMDHVMPVSRLEDITMRGQTLPLRTTQLAVANALKRSARHEFRLEKKV